MEDLLDLPVDYEEDGRETPEIAEVDASVFNQIQKARSAHTIPTGHKLVNQVHALGTIIRPGMGFELMKVEPSQDPNRQDYRDYIRVKYITKSRCREGSPGEATTLHALRLRRADRCDLKRDAGELCALVLAEDGDERTDFERGLAEFSLNNIIPFPRQIIFTNRRFPALRDTKSQYGTFRNLWENGTLICRWKRVQTCQDLGARKLKVTQEDWLQLNEEEADDERGISDAANILSHMAESIRFRQNFEGRRNAKSHSGSPRPDLPSTYEGSALSDYNLKFLDDRNSRPYTFGDHFCGFGGVSTGAREASYEIVFGNDSELPASRTYAENFPRPATRATQMDVHDFITQGTAYRMKACDVLHFSPPCQPYAFCKTVAGKNDERNQAALFSIGDLLKQHCPRFTTLEQTAGIKAIGKHSGYYLAVRRQFTDQGYSVRLKIVNLAEHNAPSERKRLIIMAAW